MEQQPQDEFSFQLLMNFLKQRRNTILLYGIVSLVLAVLLFGIGYTLLPSNKIFTQDIRIMLGEADVETVMQNMKNLPPTVSKSGQMIVIYPSGKPFVPADIINPVVLKQVYEKNKLQDMIDFDHFQNLFRSLQIIRFKPVNGLDHDPTLSFRCILCQFFTTFNH